MTTAQLERTEQNWTVMAKEPIKVQQIGGAIYAFGSELAVLRLFRGFNLVTRNRKTKASYSAGFLSWYFSLEVDE